jgi:hypothetical protein
VAMAGVHRDRRGRRGLEPCARCQAPRWLHERRRHGIETDHPFVPLL